MAPGLRPKRKSIYPSSSQPSLGVQPSQPLPSRPSPSQQPSPFLRQQFAPSQSSPSQQPSPSLPQQFAPLQSSPSQQPSPSLPQQFASSQSSPSQQLAPFPSQPSSSQASASTQSSTEYGQTSFAPVRARGRSRSLKLSTWLAAGHPKPVITFPPGLNRPIGPWAAEFGTEVGIIVRRSASLTALTWDGMSPEQQDLIFRRIEDRFVINLDDPDFKKGLEIYMRERFRQYKFQAHKHYKAVGGAAGGARDLPYDMMDKEEWKLLCDHFEDPIFLNKSKNNTTNRAKLMVNHTCGSKPYVRRREEMRDPETGAYPNMIDFYRDVTYRSASQSFVTPTCAARHAEMMALSSQPQSDDGAPLSSDEAYSRVIGTRSGYAIGLGHGAVAPSTRSSQIEIQRERRRANEAESRAAAVEEQMAQLRTEVAELRTLILSNLQTQPRQPPSS